MGKFWTRKTDTIDKKDIADPWNVAGSDAESEGLHASDLAPKAKPCHPKVYHTEQPK